MDDTGNSPDPRPRTAFLRKFHPAYGSFTRALIADVGWSSVDYRLAVVDWADPDWLAEAHAWIGEEVAALGARRIGPIEQPHIRPWSTAMRVPTTAGDLWFKANAPLLAYEALVVQVLSQVRPDLVPELVGVEPDRRWMLMRDGGERLREVIAQDRRLDRWLCVLPLYAELQLAVASRAEELAALGTPDLRLARLPQVYARLAEETEGLAPELRDRLVRSVVDVEVMCRELEEAGVPETIQHNDLHDGQIFVAGGRFLVFDWGDSCVSHPFTTMSVTIEGLLAWGLDDVEGSVDTTPFRDAYLEPFSSRVPREELEAAMSTALRLGWICRAAVTRPLALALDPGPREQLLANVRTHLRMFLDGTPT